MDGGSARATPPEGVLSTWFITPAASSHAVTVRVKDGALSAEQRFSVGPPAGTVALALLGQLPVKGRDTETTIDIRVLTPKGALDAESPPPVLQANVGTIARIEPLEPGHYRASYVLPKTRYPEVAVIVAFAPWPHPGSVHGAIGSLLVPLATAINLPGVTERNAEMSIEIAGVTFGPTRAGPDGRFELPVVVPPGHRYARGLAIDRAGNRRVSRLDLRLPPVDQLACVMNPRRLPADGHSRARIICATSDPYGAPQENANVELRVSAGRRSERRAIQDGVYEWIYTAPSELPAAGKATTVSALWRQGRNVSRDELELELVQGPASSLSLRVGEPLVHYGGKLQVIAEVRDALGRPRDDATVTARAPLGSFGAPTRVAPGTWSLSYQPPGGSTASATTISLRAFGPAGSEPAELLTWVEDHEAFAAVTDLAGWPVPDQRLRVGNRTVTTGPDGAASLGPLRSGTLDVRHERWPGLSVRLHVLDEQTAWPVGTRPGSARVEQTLTLAPPTPVVVQFTVKGRTVTYWVEDPRGKILEDRAVAVNVLGAQIAGTRREGARTSVTLSAAPAQLSVSDVATGVTGVAEVTP